MSDANYTQTAIDYERIAQAILYLETNFDKQPKLSEIAKNVHLSEYHFQRLFKRWAGISPKRFLQFLTIEYAKNLLVESKNLLDVTFETGLSSASRLHDLFVTIEAMTPGEFRNKGKGLTIFFGMHPAPFGHCLIAVTDKGICHLAFVDSQNTKLAVNKLATNWQAANLIQSNTRTQPLVNKIFSSTNKPDKTPINIFLKGTNFQIKVWQALLKIPQGYMLSYQDIAFMVSGPNATRAVANAVAKNPIAYLIPCHRVIRKSGLFGNYQWSATRKMAILGWEAANRNTVE